MANPSPFPLSGGCDCRHVRYRMATSPLFVHCCHCRWCQRESGASFALNALIESDRVTCLEGEPEWIDTPSASGYGQRIARCPKCRVALWSHYAGAGPLLAFVRVGTLEEPDHLPPDIHIFTASKQPWVVIPPGTPAVPEYYDREKHWPAESLARRAAILPQIEAYQAAFRRDAPWERRLAALWKAIDQHAPDRFVEAMDALAAELPERSAIALFERAGARDSTGHPDLAVPLYRAALAAGLAGSRRRQAVIQMASSLRNLGNAREAAELLLAELDASSDELDGAVRAFLALALVDIGREREAVATSLLALSRYLPRYNRSLARYAEDVASPK